MAIPVVSVIIPNYNHAPYLEQRIESVLLQTYREFEIILLDDCSTDNSRDIIERYRGHEKVVTIVYNDENSGSTFRQWEKGIALSRGTYVWIAESDDWCELTLLYELIQGVTSNDNCVVGYCQSYCVHETNKIKWQSRFEYLEAVEAGPEFIKKRMLTGNMIFNASMAIWRKDVFSLISKDFVQYRYCGDWLFWMELCSYGNVFISGKLLNYFRKHKGDVSGKALHDGFSLVEELKVFHILFSRKWINYGELQKSLTDQYIFYKSVEQTFAKERRKEIERLIFQYVEMTTAIKSAYYSFYTRVTAKKLLKKLIG